MEVEGCYLDGRRSKVIISTGGGRRLLSRRAEVEGYYLDGLGVAKVEGYHLDWLEVAEVEGYYLDWLRVTEIKVIMILFVQ